MNGRTTWAAGALVAVIVAAMGYLIVSRDIDGRLREVERTQDRHSEAIEQLRRQQDSGQ